MHDWTFIIALGMITLIALFVIPRWLFKRAVKQVVMIFRNSSAVNIKNAKTIDELGLRPKGFLERISKPRDYKQYALSYLINNNIVRTTEDGRLYLSDEVLRDSGLGQY